MAVFLINITIATYISSNTVGMPPLSIAVPYEYIIMVNTRNHHLVTNNTIQQQQREAQRYHHTFLVTIAMMLLTQICPLMGIIFIANFTSILRNSMQCTCGCISQGCIMLSCTANFVLHQLVASKLCQKPFCTKNACNRSSLLQPEFVVCDC